MKFILEGYDNLFIVSTLNPDNGTLLISAAAGSGEYLHDILDSLRKQTGFLCVEEV